MCTTPYHIGIQLPQAVYTNWEVPQRLAHCLYESEKPHGTSANHEQHTGANGIIRTEGVIKSRCATMVSKKVWCNVHFRNRTPSVQDPERAPSLCKQPEVAVRHMHPGTIHIRSEGVRNVACDRVVPMDL